MFGGPNRRRRMSKDFTEATLVLVPRSKDFKEVPIELRLKKSYTPLSQRNDPECLSELLAMR